jgi:hypothetical protein
MRNNFLSSGRSLLLYQFTKGRLKQALVIIVEYHYLLLTTSTQYPSQNLRPYVDEIIWDHQCGLRHQLLMRFLHSSDTAEK